MRGGLILIGTVATILLAGTAVALYFMAPPVFEGRFRSALLAVRSMHQLGAEWSVETARVQADPGANFDGLAAFVPRIKRLQGELSDSLSHIPNLPGRLTANVRAYSAAMDSLRERVERFKTAYAVIRNSERYFPLASADLIFRAEKTENKQLVREINDITVEMDLYLASPSKTTRELLTERLQKVNEARARETEEVASSVENFTAHANVLLDKRARSMELFEGIAASTLYERTKPLTQYLEDVRNKRRRTASLYQQSGIGCGGGALVMLVLVGFARRSAATQRPLSVRSAQAEGYAASQEIASSTEPVLADSSTAGARWFARTREGPTERMPVIAQDGIRAVTQSGGAGTDTMESLLTTGALAGLMGQSMGAYTRRMKGDLGTLSDDATGGPAKLGAEDTVQRWRRLKGDVNRLDFLAQRLHMLGRRVAPNDRGSIDVNQCLVEVLDETGANDICTVERQFEEVPEVHGSKTEVRLIFTLCIEYIVRGLGELRNSEAELLVWTRLGKKSVTITFIHNGASVAPEHQAGQFIPFYGSIDPRAALALPTALYLARKQGGTSVQDFLSNNRSSLMVQLPVDAGTE